MSMADETTIPDLTCLIVRQKEEEGGERDRRGSSARPNCRGGKPRQKRTSIVKERLHAPELPDKTNCNRNICRSTRYEPYP